MKLNEQIREYRKKAGLTQEQVAEQLGVSTPAVNKWESGSTCPDITLLAPLARLLKIDLNTLFTFHESLSGEEVGRFCDEVGEEAHAKGLPAGFSAAAAKLREYPNCDLLRYSLALLLDGVLALSALPPEDRAGYERKLTEWYEQAADGQDEETREAAIGVLANKYLSCGKTEEAQRLLSLLPDKRAVDTQMLKINVLMKQGKYREAASMAELKIFSDITAMQNYFIKLTDLDLLLNETDAAADVAEASRNIAEILGLWEYGAYVCPLRTAAASKDAAKSLECIDAMLSAALTPIKAPAVFRHLPVKPIEDDLPSRMLALLLHQFETGAEYDFLRSDPDFQALLAKYRKQLPNQ